MTERTLAERDALAAKMFPREWAAANSKPRASERRRKLRIRAEGELILRELRAQGCKCATCEHFASYPHGQGNICELGTDFQGYQIAQPFGLCGMWKAG